MSRKWRNCRPWLVRIPTRTTENSGRVKCLTLLENYRMSSIEDSIIRTNRCRATTRWRLVMLQNPAFCSRLTGWSWYFLDWVFSASYQFIWNGQCDDWRYFSPPPTVTRLSMANSQATCSLLSSIIQSAASGTFGWLMNLQSKFEWVGNQDHWESE